MQKIKTLNVHTVQGFSGVLSRESQFVFNYRTDDPSCEIALSMPLRAKSYASNILPGALRQNMPEGYLDDWIREHLAKVAKIDDMTILAITGRDVIGRIRCLQDGDDGRNLVPGERLNDILTWKGTEDLFAHLAEQYALASGISGVQPKVIVPVRRERNAEKNVIEKSSIKDRGLIVKSAGEDYPGLAENEFCCMSIAKNAGLEVPDFWLSDDRRLFVVERFDIGETGYRGFEDMTALMNKQNNEKYNSSYETVAKAVSLFASPAHVTPSLNALFSSVTLSMLLRNGDAHLKNFGVLYTHPQSDDCRLSPLFDIVNTTAYLPKDVPALLLNGQKAWPLTKDLIEFGKKHCRVDRPEQVIERIATAAMEYRPDEHSVIWDKMKPEIDYGCFGLAGKRLHGVGVGGNQSDVLLQSLVRDVPGLDSFIKTHQYSVDELDSQSGRYDGPILWTDGWQAVQSVDRDRVVVIHDVRAWSTKPVINDLATVQYRAGVPAVKVMNAEQGRALSGGR